jgi:hypothetical protein
MSNFRFGSWVKYSLVNLYPSEGEVAAKRVDAAKLNAILGEAAELPGLRYTHGSDCEQAGGSSPTQLDLYLCNSYGKRGIVNNGERVWAWDGSHVWLTAASADDRVILVNGDLIAGSDVADYTQLNLSNLHFLALQGAVGWQLGRDDIARGSRSGALHLDDLQFSDDDATNALTALEALADAFSAAHTNEGEHKDGVIAESNLSPDCLVNQGVLNYVHGGMEYLGEDGKSDGTQQYPAGWLPYNAPQVLERSSERAYSGAFSARVVTSGSDQGLSTVLDVSNFRGQVLSVSAMIYCVDAMRVVLEIYDGVATYSAVAGGSSNGWQRLAKVCTIAENATTLEIRIKSNAAGTFHADDVMACHGAFPLHYTPSFWESQMGAAQVKSAWRNLMGNADFGLFPAGSDPYYPFLWQKGTADATSSTVDTDPANQIYGSNVWNLKLEPSQSVIYEAVAPTQDTARRFYGSMLSFTVDLKPHATPGDDPIELFIEDSAGLTSRAVKYDGTGYTRFTVSRPIVDGVSWIRVGVRNNSGHGSFCRYYIGGVQLQTGTLHDKWSPGDYLVPVVISQGYSGTPAAGTFLNHAGVAGSTTHGPQVNGVLAGIFSRLSYSNTPTADTWRLYVVKTDDTSINDGFTASAKLYERAYSLARDYCWRNARLSCKLNAVGATTGANPILCSTAYLIP